MALKQDFAKQIEGQIAVWQAQIKEHQDLLKQAGAKAQADTEKAIRAGLKIAPQGTGQKGAPIAALEDKVLKRGTPFLGICVGMQLMASVGVEFGTHRGLDWIKGKVVVLDPADQSLRIPQMGWNDLRLANVAHPALSATQTGDHAYFVHSYHFIAERPQDVLATVEHGGPVTAIIGRDNLLGVQFHPEKSQQVGLNLLARFLTWTP